MKTELLLPAADLEKTIIAFQYGADACYGGTPAFSMRTREIGFNYSSLKKAILYAHSLNKKFYVTINVFPNENELLSLKNHIKKILNFKPDAIIAADLGVVSIVRNIDKKIEIHLSTQANAMNSESIKIYQSLGIKRVILARELSIQNIKNISKNIPKNIELECFIHGAMCMSISGRCHLSNYLTGRDANHGACTQVCRWNFAVTEEKRPNIYLPVEQDERYSYIFNAKDLCMAKHLQKLKGAGIKSFKIEGRNKSIYYVATVAKSYRKLVDNLNNSNFQKIAQKEQKELEKITNRGYSTGFYLGKPSASDINYNTSRPSSDWRFVGIVTKILSKNQYQVEVKNQIKKGDKIEIITPSDSYCITLDHIISLDKDYAEHVSFSEER